MSHFHLPHIILHPILSSRQIFSQQIIYLLWLAWLLFVCVWTERALTIIVGQTINWQTTWLLVEIVLIHCRMYIQGNQCVYIGVCAVERLFNKYFPVHNYSLLVLTPGCPCGWAELCPFSVPESYSFRLESKIRPAHGFLASSQCCELRRPAFILH